MSDARQYAMQYTGQGMLKFRNSSISEIYLLHRLQWELANDS